MNIELNANNVEFNPSAKLKGVTERKQVILFHFTADLLTDIAPLETIRIYESFFSMFNKDNKESDVSSNDLTKKLKTKLNCNIQKEESFEYWDRRRKLIPLMIEKLEENGFEFLYKSDKWFSLLGSEENLEFVKLTIKDSIRELFQDFNADTTKPFYTLKYRFLKGDKESSLTVSMYLNTSTVSNKNSQKVLEDEVLVKNTINRLTFVKKMFDERIKHPDMLTINEQKINKNFFKRFKCAIYAGLLEDDSISLEDDSIYATNQN